MALSEQTLEHMLDAETHMRAAIRSAASNEKPVIVSQLAKILLDIEKAKRIEEVMDMIENREEGSSGHFGIMIDPPEED